MTYELKSCPFCAKPLTVRNGVNPYGRCDTEGCWMAEAKIGISCDDPKQVERWNTRPAPAATDSVGEPKQFQFGDGPMPIVVTAHTREEAQRLYQERINPAATDTRLETVAWQRKHPTEGWMDCREEDIPHYAKQGQEVRQLSPRSQAVELLAAKEAECAKYRDYAAEKSNQVAALQQSLAHETADNAAKDAENLSLSNSLTFTDKLASQRLERAEKAEADNAALTARVEVLEKLCNDTEAEALGYASDKAELEAKLTAAEKALEPFADHANDRAVDDTGWRDKETVKIVVSIGDLRKARAVLRERE